MEETYGDRLSLKLFELLHDSRARAGLSEVSVQFPELGTVDPVELERAAANQRAGLRSQLGKESAARRDEFMISGEYLTSRKLIVTAGQPNLISGFGDFLKRAGLSGARAESYHVHIYYGEGDLGAIQQLHSRLAAMFPDASFDLARLPRGPHPQSYLEIQFSGETLSELRPLLVLCSRRWSVLLHKVTDSDRRDHTEHAEWFGEPVRLDFSVFTT
jgi:aromatic ring-cleaving dioxygenase